MSKQEKISLYIDLSLALKLIKGNKEVKLKDKNYADILLYKLKMVFNEPYSEKNMNAIIKKIEQFVNSLK